VSTFVSAFLQSIEYRGDRSVGGFALVLELRQMGIVIDIEFSKWCLEWVRYWSVEVHV